MKGLLSLAVIVATAGVAGAQVRINELLVNPPGADNGFEFFEFAGPAGFSLNNIWLVGIEGDSTGAGLVDVAINYTGFSIGSNGLFLHRDASTVLSPAPDAGTNIRVLDFNPDLENGSTTWLLVTNFTGTIGTTDIDTDNDGLIDGVMPWSSVLNSIALIENDGPANFGYATAFGGVNFGPQASFNADAFVYGINNLYYGMDVLGANPGPYSFDTNRMADQTGALVSIAGQLTPGRLNVIPTPGALALLALGSALTLRRRRAN